MSEELEAAHLVWCKAAEGLLKALLNGAGQVSCKYTRANLIQTLSECIVQFFRSASYRVRCYFDLSSLCWMETLCFIFNTCGAKLLRGDLNGRSTN